MTQKEIKKELQELAHDALVAVESFARDSSTAEADLSEAKSSAKKLIEKIEEYLESQEPEFKVGDYVTYKGIENKIAKIDSIDTDELHGLWYGQETEVIRQDLWLKGGHTVRRATPEEIAEYKAALNFYKHGRDPFEVRIGDLVQNANGHKHIIAMAFNNKDLFLLNNTKLLATAEEIDEWLGADDE